MKAGRNWLLQLISSNIHQQRTCPMSSGWNPDPLLKSIVLSLISIGARVLPIMFLAMLPLNVSREKCLQVWYYFNTWIQNTIIIKTSEQIIAIGFFAHVRNLYWIKLIQNINITIRFHQDEQIMNLSSSTRKVDFLKKSLTQHFLQDDVPLSPHSLRMSIAEKSMISQDVMDNLQSEG